MAYTLDDDGRGNYRLVQPPNANKTAVTRPKASTLALPRLTVGSDNVYKISNSKAPTYSGSTKRAAAPKASTISKATASSGPSAAEVAAQRAAAEAAAARAKAISAANEAGRSQAQQSIEKLNSQITANLSKKAINDQSLKALTGLVGTGEGSHAAVRDNALKILDNALAAKMDQIRSTFSSTMQDLTLNLRDNESSESDSSFQNLSNRAREKQDLVTQALSQGAGESDVLKAQLQALRNWSSNQGDINRSFYDTRTSVNSAITDLNVGTKTGMMNEELSTNAARGSRWDDYYESMSDSLAEMANLDQNNYLLMGEIGAAEKEKANYMSVLDWLDSGKNMEDYKSPALASRTAAAADPYTSDYAQRAAQMAGSVWEDPGISADTQNWQGAEQSKTELTNAQPWNAQDNTQLGTKKKRPEGAILRRW